MKNKICNVYIDELNISAEKDEFLAFHSHNPFEAKTSEVTKEESADETKNQPDTKNKNAQKGNLKRNCNQRNMVEKRRKNVLLIDNLACLNEHLQIARKDLLQISCKINELQELNKRKEIEQCRNSNFVCCCLLLYVVFCLFFILFGGSWLYSNFL